MNYQAFTNDSLTMMYQGARGALAVDDALSELGKQCRFRVRETPEWKYLSLISKPRCSGAEWCLKSSIGRLTSSVPCTQRSNKLHSNTSYEGKLPDKMNIVIALRDQQFQLKRLLEMQLWVGAPEATLEQIEAQLLATKATLAALEQLIVEQKARMSSIMKRPAT